MIALPHNYSHFEKDFAFSLFQMQHKFYEWVIKNKRNDNVSIISQGGFRIDDMRNELVRFALKHDITHILFLDTDMVFPSDTISMLIEDFEDNPEVDAISGLYTWKRPPYAPHVYKGINEDTGAFGMISQFPLNELFQIDGAGGGCLMIKMDFFKKFPNDIWFSFEVAGDKIKKGEDLYFFDKFRPLTLCDPRLKCVHLTQRGYSIDDYIDSNGLTRCEGGFIGTPEQFNKISEKHDKNFVSDGAVDKS